MPPTLTRKTREFVSKKMFYIPFSSWEKSVSHRPWVSLCIIEKKVRVERLMDFILERPRDVRFALETKSIRKCESLSLGVCSQVESVNFPRRRFLLTGARAATRVISFSPRRPFVGSYARGGIRAGERIRAAVSAKFRWYARCHHHGCVCSVSLLIRVHARLFTTPPKATEIVRRDTLRVREVWPLKVKSPRNLRTLHLRLSLANNQASQMSRDILISGSPQERLERIPNDEAPFVPAYHA